MSFLGLEGKTFLVLGVANKKSVAYHIGKALEEEKANVIYSVRSEKRKESVVSLLQPSPVLVCDVEKPDEIDRLREEVARETKTLHGLAHSIAFANYAEGLKPFHETKKEDFLHCRLRSSAKSTFPSGLRECLRRRVRRSQMKCREQLPTRCRLLQARGLPPRPFRKRTDRRP